MITGVASARVELHATAVGVVRSEVERRKILSPASGVIVSRPVADNARVRKGDVLLKLDDAEPAEQLAKIQFDLAEQSSRRDDTALILDCLAVGPTGRSATATTLKTRSYLAEWQDWLGSLQSLRRSDELARRNQERAETLHGRGLISLVDYETTRLRATESTGTVALHLLKGETRWQSEKENLDRSLVALRTQVGILVDRRARLVVTAPCDGTLMGFQGWAEGTHVPANVLLGEISPDESLVVETIVTSRDRANIREGQSAIVRLDSFPYSEWGHVPATVVSVGRDSQVANNLPGFRVILQLATDRIGGRTAQGAQPIQKGMVAQVLFNIGRQRLWRLWFSSLTEALDPTNAPVSSSAAKPNLSPR
ncbi:MAG: HlyD family efflux transporter periplasmic adaptor subunit [Opitutae bacterium]|nr:HlyD family efflux transporter periplasmic adaptor subunit [Opitutae bacterium]